MDTRPATADTARDISTTHAFQIIDQARPSAPMPGERCVEFRSLQWLSDKKITLEKAASLREHYAHVFSALQRSQRNEQFQLEQAAALKTDLEV